MASQPKSRFRGVYRCGKRWKAQLQSQGVQFYLGTFDSEEEAAKAYDRKAREEKGEKSQTNYDDMGTETGVCQYRSFTDERIESFADDTFYSDADCRISGQLYLSPRLSTLNPASDQVRIMWERLSQLTQRYVLADATREKLLELHTSSPDAEKAVLLRSLEEECSLLAVVRAQLEEALARSLSGCQMPDSSGSTGGPVGALPNLRDHHVSPLWQQQQPTRYVGTTSMGIPSAYSAAAASYPSSSAHARSVFAAVTGVAGGLSSTYGYCALGSTNDSQTTAAADPRINGTGPPNAPSATMGINEGGSVPSGPSFAADAKDCLRSSAGSLGAGATTTTSSTVSTGSDGDE